jgi:hypothetical protein
MPALTAKKVNEIIKMLVEKVKADIINKNKDNNELVLQCYPNGRFFDEENYWVTLKKIYGSENEIPAIFREKCDIKLNVNLSTHFLETQQIKLSSIMDELNTVDKKNPTSFRLTDTNDSPIDKELHTTLFIEKTPSIFMQLATSPAAAFGLMLLLIGASLLSAATLGTTIVGATAAVGSIALISSAFFATKKPGVKGVFSHTHVTDEIMMKIAGITVK